ncbi:MAG: hypothetical protein KJ950_12630 [Proteobacteria bacterium]|nr:hypothetical protein [Pseudomonadota bacterium]MBU1688445.1 hypothetical protein [Pseudomonadota bacterium]
MVKSLVYFVDADQEPDPVSLAEVSWERIKEDIRVEERLLFAVRSEKKANDE